MELIQSELRQLLDRQVEIRQAMRRPGGIRVTMERELFAIGEKLKQYPIPLEIAGAESQFSARRQ